MDIKKGDFIELDFVAKLKSTGSVFDTTLEQVAKDNGFFSKEMHYKPIVACVGEGHLLKGLDDFVLGKTIGKYTVDIDALHGFGKKDAKLLRLVSIHEFHKNKINPMPGLDVDLDGNRGTVRTVNGGRVIVDFNHPLASQDLVYDIDIKSIVVDDKKKIEAVLTILKIPYKSVEISEGKAVLEFEAKLPDELTKPLADEIVRLVGIRDIMFK